MKPFLVPVLAWFWTLVFGTYAELPAPNPPSRLPSLVKATPQRGLHDAPVHVELTAQREGAKIRYTADGTEPTAARSQEYSSPIQVTNTTLLRAAVFDGKKRVSTVETFTYLFLDAVLRQPKNPPGLPSGSDTWGGFPALYEMDPRVVNDPAYKPRMKDALRALPTLSIVCSPQDLFSPRTGLYLNSTQRGPNWERAASAELILPEGSEGFQIDCALQIQGNASREPERSLKHAFRLTFKEPYGPGKLRYPVFPDSPITNFNTLVLRADFNNSWMHWDPSQRARGQRTRDAWMKDTFRAMGHLASHNRYVHLYLNGLYWGIYDLTERPDAAFAASYLGGTREDYDVINEMQVKDGTLAAFARLWSMRNLASPAQYEQLKKQLDVTQFIDYLLLNYYGGNQDWGDGKNWYAIRRHNPPGPFQFMVWDGEHVLANPDDPFNVPLRLARELMNNAEFRTAFAARVQKHCFNDGALTPKACADRWMARAKEVDLAIIAESARWGYYRRNPPYTRDRDWMAEQRRLMNNYFPRRTEIFVNQLRKAGLYPR